MGWTLAPLELRDIDASDGCGLTLAADGRDDSAPSISGVVGSSLYISAVGNFVFAAKLRREIKYMSAWCSALAPAVLRGHL